MTGEYLQLNICPVKCIWLPFIAYPLTCWMTISGLTCPKQFTFPHPCSFPDFATHLFHTFSILQTVITIYPGSQAKNFPYLMSYPLVNNVISLVKIYWNSNQIWPPPLPPPSPKHPHCGGHRGVLIGPPFKKHRDWQPPAATFFCLQSHASSDSSSDWFSNRGEGRRE